MKYISLISAYLNSPTLCFDHYWIYLQQRMKILSKRLVNDQPERNKNG